MNTAGMTPRAYVQDRRAARAADTRKRIRDSAFELYRERGVASTTVQAIAERADVSRGTVMNHFGGADGVLDAVLDEVVPGLEYPDERLQDGATDDRQRIRRYVDAMFRFFVRSEIYWPALRRDMDHPILKARAAEYYAVIGRLYAVTFGELATDRIVSAAARAYVNYAPLNDLRAAGLTLDQTIEVVSDSLIALAAQRRRTIKRLVSAKRGEGGKA
jgi:AcrR family transcriptional regulator